MTHTYQTPDGYDDQEVAAVLAESIASHLAFAQRRLAAYQACCLAFEQKHGMSTEQFLERFDAGSLGD